MFSTMTDREKFENLGKVVDGVFRWDVNGSVPPMDVIESFIAAGCPVDLAACKVAKDADLDRLFAQTFQYTQEQEDERMYELRAAGYARGEVVVNVLTGVRTVVR